jgi:hypothetical protein
VADLPAAKQRAAVKKVRTGKAKTLRQAAAGDQIKQLVDEGLVSLADAARVKKLSAKAKKEAAQAVRAGKARTLAEAAGLGGPIQDGLGLELDARAADYFDVLPLFDEALSHLRKELQQHRRYGTDHFDLAHLEQAREILNARRPFASVCPYCRGQHSGKFAKDCKACAGSGVVTELQFNQATPEARRTVEALRKTK